MKYLKYRSFPGLIAIFLVAVVTAPAQLSVGSPLVIREIVRGGEIHGANGMYFNSQDQLYIASANGMEIIIMDRNSGKILDRLGNDVGVGFPDDLTFGPDGSLYWTNIIAGEVVRLSPSGVRTSQFVAPGVNPITFSADGRLFVALDFYGDGLYELDPDLADPPRPIIVANAQNPYPLGFLNAFDFGPDGRLYGPLWLTGGVISIDVDSCSNTSNPWADCDIDVVTDIPHPAAVKFDSKGNLYLADQTGPVYSVDAGTGIKTIVAALEPALDNLAFDSLDNLYVSNSLNGSITRILPSGEGRQLHRGVMMLPGGVAVLPNIKGGESVFIADVWTLREFNGLTGREIGFTISTFPRPGIIAPQTVSADGENLILASWINPAVQVLNRQTGQVVEQYPMSLPLNAIRFGSDILAADPFLGGVVRVNDLQVIIGPPYVFFPTGLAADDDTLWVADWATGMVWQVGFAAGMPLPPVVVATGLSGPEGLALDHDGSLLVVEAGSQELSRIDLTSFQVSTLASGLELGFADTSGLLPPTYVFNGVAVGPSGAIYVTGDTGNVLYRIWPR